MKITYNDADLMMQSFKSLTTEDVDLKYVLNKNQKALSNALIQFNDGVYLSSIKHAKTDKEGLLVKNGDQYGYTPKGQAALAKDIAKLRKEEVEVDLILLPPTAEVKKIFLTNPNAGLLIPIFPDFSKEKAAKKED